MICHSVLIISGQAINLGDNCSITIICPTILVPGLSSSRMDPRQSHLIALLGLSCCITTLVTATCQPPDHDYTLETSVDKFYKPVKNKVTWQAARDACSSEGAFLVELRTEEEYKAIRPIFGKLLIWQTRTIFIQCNIFYYQSLN